MKKSGIKFLATTVFLILMSISPFATATGDISVSVNNIPVQFDVAPQLINDRTMVPMRAIFERLGAEVFWNGETQTVTALKGTTTVKATIGNSSITVNDTVKTIDTPPVIVNDRTLVPVRFISESLGYSVDWDAQKREVLITNGLNVHFIDVGQADSILIESNNETMLIDGGNEADGNLVLNYLKSQNIDYLDYIVCTHGHEDHVGGLPFILENVNVGVVISDDDYDSLIFKSFLSKINDKQIPRTEPYPGYSFELGNSQITFLTSTDSVYSDYNDTSIVFKLTHMDNSFIFTGDAGFATENNIMASSPDIDIDVLKVGHHGSSTATSYGFMEATTPDYAIISCGKDNSYGHPTNQTLNTLSSFNTTVYRTDTQGNITASSDGDTLYFTFEKIPEPVSTVQTPVNPPNVTAPSAPVNVPNTIQQPVSTSYIGNKNSKKLHLPTCSSLPAESNRVYFSVLSEALGLGYEACKKCKPN